MKIMGVPVMAIAILLVGYYVGSKKPGLLAKVPVVGSVFS